jgi:Flp pilus assembly protein TadB
MPWANLYTVYLHAPKVHKAKQSSQTEKHQSSSAAPSQEEEIPLLPYNSTRRRNGRSRRSRRPRHEDDGIAQLLGEFLFASVHALLFVGVLFAVIYFGWVVVSGVMVMLGWGSRAVFA